MCAIAGIFSWNEPVGRARIKSMTDAMWHRGPDDSGIWVDPSARVGLGHRRLAILDLSDHGHQPMRSDDGRFTLVYNGEIYNYLELRSELQSEGYRFESTGDTEVLLAMYRRYGAGCLSHLDGMFAFAVWDGLEQRLFCARDRFGEKPFFYFLGANEFIFASEIKALLKAGIKKDISPSRIYSYLQDSTDLLDSEHEDSTFYRNIMRLSPSTSMIVERGGVLRRRKYWQLDQSRRDQAITIEDAIDQFRDLFERSIVSRLRSDVSVGSSLSGGLDSSSIVCGIHRLKGNALRQNCFSARFPDYIEDEGRYIELVNRKVGSTPHYAFPNVGTFLESFEDFFAHHDEPVVSASVFAQWEVMKLAQSEGITVLLDGQGADEMLAGYEHYAHILDEELSKSEGLSRAEDLDAGNRDAGHRAQGLLSNGIENMIKRSYNRSDLRRLVYRSRYRSHYLDPDFLFSVFPYRRSRYSHMTCLESVLRQDMTNGKLETLLRYADHNSMAFSREVRLPFLSHQIVEFVFSLPSTYKIRDGWSKYLLRAAMKHVLPPEICWRRDKIGFSVPQGEWLRDERVTLVLNDSILRLKKMGIINKRCSIAGIPSDRIWQVLSLGQIL